MLVTAKQPPARPHCHCFGVTGMHYNLTICTLFIVPQNLIFHVLALFICSVDAASSKKVFLANDHIHSQERLRFLMHFMARTTRALLSSSINIIRSQEPVLSSLLAQFTLLVINVKNHSVFSRFTLLRFGIHYVIHHSHRRLYPLPPVINSFFVLHCLVLNKLKHCSQSSGSTLRVNLTTLRGLYLA